MHDDEFARVLRDRLDAAAPRVHVHTERVLPRAHRRRAVVRSLTATAALTAVVAGGAWAADARPWGEQGPVGPAVTGQTDPTRPDPTVTDPAPAPSAVPTADPVEPAQGTYWYTLVQSSGAEGTHTNESWRSLTEPGLLVRDGDLANAGAMGPVNVLGRFRIDGGWVDMLRDDTLLPSDPAALEAVLRASVEPDRRSGTDDDKVFGMTQDLLHDAWRLPVDLRQAVWTVAAGLPGSVTGEGTDATGRPGDTLEHSQDGVVTRWVREATTGLLLEESSDGWAHTYTEQRWVDAPPVEPTLEMAGCTAWVSC